MSQAAESAPLPSRQDTGEFILLKRAHVNWYAPALYKMVGGSFDEMLTAIRALPKEQRSFEVDWHTGKRWIINQKALDTLKAQGFSIEKEPDMRLVYRIEEIESKVSSDWNGNHTYLYRIPVTLKIRNKHGQMQEVETLMVILHDGEEVWDWARKVQEAHAACLVLRERIVTTWEEVRKNERSLEAWVRAADAIQPFLGRVFIWCGHEPPPDYTVSEEESDQPIETPLLLLSAPAGQKGRGDDGSA